MKKNILIIIGILFSLSLFAGAGQNREGKPWTVMVYIVADNSLGGESDSGEITGPNYAVDNINQMLEIGDTRNFNLVLMYDGPNFKLNKDSKTTYEPGYYYIENGKFYLDPKNQPVSKDSGNVATLKGFVEYAKVNYPAEHYCLSLWNHGGGVDHIKQIIMAMGICYDKNQQSYNPGDKGFEDFISDRQLVDMLNDVYSDSKLDILIEDACMMQMAALNYELKNSVNFVCASEAREGDGGCDYSEMLKIFTLPGFNTKKTKEIASYFVISQKTNEGLITFSAVDLKQMYNGEKFNGLFSRFSTSLYSKVEGAPKNKKAALAQKTILCLALTLWDIPGGLSKVITVGISHNKFSIGEISFSLTQRTFLMMMILGLINFTTEYISNQNVIQRYMAAKSTREARKATIICAASSVPTWLLFFFIGTCLFVYYNVNPVQPIEHLNADQVMPYFILTKIPVGLAGLILAGCLAAAMSTLSSSISAMSSVATVDLFERYIFRNRDDKFYLKIGKWCSFISFILMIVGAIIFKFIPRENMVDLGFILSGMFGGCILGIYLLGFFTTRVSNFSLLIGMFSAIAVNIYLMLDTLNVLPNSLSLKMNSYYIVIAVNLTIVIISMGFSFFYPNRKKLKGLTVWTMKD